MKCLKCIRRPANPKTGMCVECAMEDGDTEEDEGGEDSEDLDFDDDEEE